MNVFVVKLLILVKYWNGFLRDVAHNSGLFCAYYFATAVMITVLLKCSCEPFLKVIIRFIHYILPLF